MNKIMKRSLGVAILAFGAVAAQAITFTNVIITSPPLSNGSSYNAIGNSISFFTPNAIVGDSVGIRFGTLNIQYDASSTVNMLADTVTVNLASAILGSGQILFRELIFEIDCNTGSEIGGPIGTSTHTFDANNSPFFTEQIVLSRQAQCIRAKKSFTMLAPDTSAFDIAALAIVNQSISTVPEPSSMIALGVGALALLRRRRS